VHVLPTDSTFT